MFAGIAEGKYIDRSAGGWGSEINLIHTNISLSVNHSLRMFNSNGNAGSFLCDNFTGADLLEISFID